MRYRLVNVLVTRVFQRAEVLRGYKDERGETQFEYGPEFWYVHFDGSSESLKLGDEKPELKAGDRVDIVITPRSKK